MLAPILIACGPRRSGIPSLGLLHLGRGNTWSKRGHPIEEDFNESLRLLKVGVVVANDDKTMVKGGLGRVEQVGKDVLLLRLEQPVS